MFLLAQFSGAELEAAAGRQDLVGNRQGCRGRAEMRRRGANTAQLNPQLAAVQHNSRLTVMKQDTFGVF